MTLEVSPLFLLFFALLFLSVYFLGWWRGQGAQLKGADWRSLFRALDELPSRVLITLQGSLSQKKGKVGELLTYAALRYDYDRIIPLGSPVDFIGVKFGSHLDFIEVKTGEAQLSKEEKEIQDLIKLGRIRFRKVVVRDDEIHFGSEQEVAE